MMKGTVGVFKEVEPSVQDGVDELTVVADGKTGPFETLLIEVADETEVAELTVTAVSLPAPSVLLLAGLFGVGMMRRKS